MSRKHLFLFRRYLTGLDERLCGDPNILQYFGSFVDGDQLWLVTGVHE
jgi:hypothetical protein